MFAEFQITRSEKAYYDGIVNRNRGGVDRRQRRGRRKEQKERRKGKLRLGCKIIEKNKRKNLQSFKFFLSFVYFVLWELIIKPYDNRTLQARFLNL